MLQSIEAVVDQNGVLRLIEPVEFPRLRRVIITFLDEEPEESMDLERLKSVEVLENGDGSASIDCLQSIAGTFESGTEDTSKNVKSTVTEATQKI